MARTSRLLILVATDLVHRTVVDAVRALTESSPRHESYGHYPVAWLGQVHGVDVLVAHGPVQLIARIRPDHVVFTGTCFGSMHTAHAVGDVLVPTQLRVIDQRVAVPQPSTGLLQACRSASDGWRPGRVHFGPLVSADSRIDPVTFRARLIVEHPDAVGGELEPAGFSATAVPATTEWITVKAICGWGTGPHDVWRRRAAAVAAQFLIHLLRNRALAQSDPSPQVRTEEARW